jgi:hypothetical protein
MRVQPCEIQTQQRQLGQYLYRCDKVVTQDVINPRSSTMAMMAAVTIVAAGRIDTAFILQGTLSGVTKMTILP